MTTWNDVIRRKLSPGDYLLLAANLIPVYGVWFLQWNAREVFIVYCLETILIGFFTLVKLGITGYIKKSDDWSNNGKSIRMPAVGFMLFFLVHYGMFVSIQMGIFFSVSGIGHETGIGFFNFYSKLPGLLTEEIYLMLGGFMITYAYRDLTGFILSGEYRSASLSFLMFQPYGRIFIQQVTVIVGSIFLSFGAGKIFILVFALVKLFFEVFVNFDRLIRQAAKGELKT